MALVLTWCPDASYWQNLKRPLVSSASLIGILCDEACWMWGVIRFSSLSKVGVNILKHWNWRSSSISRTGRTKLQNLPSQGRLMFSSLTFSSLTFDQCFLFFFFLSLQSKFNIITWTVAMVYYYWFIVACWWHQEEILCYCKRWMEVWVYSQVERTNRNTDIRTYVGYKGTLRVSERV